MKFKKRCQMPENMKQIGLKNRMEKFLLNKKEQTFKKTFAFIFAVFLVGANLFQFFFTNNFSDSCLVPCDEPHICVGNGEINTENSLKPPALSTTPQNQKTSPNANLYVVNGKISPENPLQCQSPILNTASKNQKTSQFAHFPAFFEENLHETLKQNLLLPQEISQRVSQKSILTQSESQPLAQKERLLLSDRQEEGSGLTEKNLLANDYFDLYDKSENGFGEIFDNELDSLDLKVFDDFIKSLPSQFFFDSDIKTSIKKLLNGEFFASDESFLSGISNFFLSDLKQILPQFALILSATLMVGFFSNLSSNHLSKGIENLVNFSLILAVILLSTTMIISTIQEVGTSIFSLQSQMNAIFPILLTLIFALGGTASVSVYSPTLYILSSVMGSIITKIVFPLFLMAYGISILSSMTESFNLCKISDFFKSVSKYVVGITFTVFFATITLKGISVSTVDSVTLRTAKYAISSSVPLVGGYLKDGFDLIMFSLLLVKNSVGVMAAFLAIATILNPMSKLVLLILLFKMVEGLTQPFASKRLSGFFSETSKSLGLVLGVFLSVFFMYAISIIILMVSTNLIL